jgi:hypothetical protein
MFTCPGLVPEGKIRLNPKRLAPQSVLLMISLDSDDEGLSDNYADDEVESSDEESAPKVCNEQKPENLIKRRTNQSKIEQRRIRQEIKLDIQKTLDIKTKEPVILTANPNES